MPTSPMPDPAKRSHYARSNLLAVFAQVLTFGKVAIITTLTATRKLGPLMGIPIVCEVLDLPLYRSDFFLPLAIAKWLPVLGWPSSYSIRIFYFGGKRYISNIL